MHRIVVLFTNFSVTVVILSINKENKNVQNTVVKKKINKKTLNLPNIFRKSYTEFLKCLIHKMAPMLIKNNLIKTKYHLNN